MDFWIKFCGTENNGINGNNGTESAVKENAWDGKKRAQISQEKEIVISVQHSRTLCCQWSLAFISLQLQIAKLDLD